MHGATLEILAEAIDTTLDSYQSFNESYERFKQDSTYTNLDAVAVAFKQTIPANNRVALLLPQFSREQLEPMNELIISFVIEHCHINNAIMELRKSLTLIQHCRLLYIMGSR